MTFPLKPLRLASIDVFRAVTMLLMIFVNDLWTLTGIPAWLGHTQAQEDGMGLADTIFPAFLFIVGLSLPFAIMARQAKGDNRHQLLTYIFTRSLALLVMGFFHVNLENYDPAAALLPRPVWQIIITIGFFLVWLDYPPTMQRSKRNWLKGTGIAVLAAMAIVYAGKENGQVVWMRPQWWGILGLIGWSYLLCATVLVLSQRRLTLLIAAWLFFLAFNIAEHAGWLGWWPIRQYVWLVGDGSMPALTMAGVVAAVIYEQLKITKRSGQSIVLLILIAALILAAGFAIRPLDGISKIRATPSWVMICTGISLSFFVVMIVVVDKWNKKHWFDVIRPAGTSTLTCYLLPYIHYAIYAMAGISLPLALRTGTAGVAKSLLYALAIILIVRVLEKWKIRLKV